MTTEKIRTFEGFSKANMDSKQKELEDQDKEILDRCAKGEKVILPGQGGTELEEPLVTFEPTQAEVIYPQQKSTHWGRHRIVFGRDRHTREGLSGYGGRGATAAGSIDIVVGSGGPIAKHGQIVGPNFYTDAARIYLTQRGDIDRYFNLPEDIPNGLLPSENRSAVGIKADAIRIVGREGVRIYTNARTSNSGKQSETNSQGGDIQSKSGIHLIANMDVGTVDPSGFSGPVTAGQLGSGFNNLQPLVKGDFLVGFLEDLLEEIQNLQNALVSFANYQLEFNTIVASHTHEVVTAAPAVAIPDLKALVPQSIKNVIGTTQDTTVKTILGEVQTKIQTNYNWLKPTSPIYILSRYNKTN